MAAPATETEAKNRETSLSAHHQADPSRHGEEIFAGSERPRRIVAIVNPATRRNAHRIIENLWQEAPTGVELDIRLTPAARSATDLTREVLPGTDMVVAIGGDGTVGEVATALRGTGVPLGIVPAGSTNIVARDLGIPRAPAAAIAVLFGAHRRIPLDVGLCGEHAFLHMAGAGLDSRLFGAANPGLKRRIGWLAYLPPGGRELLRPPARFEVSTDDEVHEVTSPLVLVANGGSIITPRLTLYPGFRKDDGYLDVLIFTASNPIRVVRTLGRLATRHLDCSPFVLHRRARRVTLSADPPLPVQLDGDVVTRTPVSFTLDPMALVVIVPPHEVA
ncbi:MAG: hypothetical protein M3Q71_05390 [Chloroflexota bacterium]|nr:hypothetical protein [Chloroflexota bacterium]